MWRFILTVFLCCTLLLGATLLFSHLLPSSADQSALARNPCALPCFYGITSGQTTRAQALQSLAQYLDASQVNAASISFVLRDSQDRRSFASVNFNSSGLVGSIQLIGIDPFASMGQLGDLLLSGQTPTHIFHTCTNLLPVRFLITFGAHDELVAEVFPLGNLTPNSQITLFDLSTPAARSLYEATLSFGCSVKTDWLGLAPLWKYFVLDKSAVWRPAAVNLSYN